MDLATRLELLEGRFALLDAYYRYADAFDERDPELLRAVFHDDGVLDLGELWGTHEGIEAIIASAEQSLAGAASMHHWMANPLIDLDVDAGVGSGSVSLDCVSTFIETGPAHVGGRYRDRFRRDDGVWKISERKLEVQFVTPMPEWVAVQGTEAASHRS
jgi:hypothetical protein